MDLLASHMVLASGENRVKCRAQILRFFKETSLVHYDRIDVKDHLVFSGRDEGFSANLDQAVAQNRAVLAGLINELQSVGFENRGDLSTLPQGYPSKVLHIIAHFLDGFIGIDTVFYNIIDDSHWLPAETGKKISQEPDRFWLFPLDCYSMTPREAALLHM